jgi:oligosaccharyltransferase complex subunit alpha (ribophorin I)
LVILMRVNKDLVVKSCDQTIDLSSQLVKINNKLNLANNGQGAIKTFLFSVDPAFKKNVANIRATTGSSDKTYLWLSEAKVQGHLEKPLWKVEVKDAIVAGGSVTVNVELVQGLAQEMYPAAITQKDKQLVRFTGNHYVYLPYSVMSQSTIQ